MYIAFLFVIYEDIISIKQLEIYTIKCMLFIQLHRHINSIIFITS